MKNEQKEKMFGFTRDEIFEAIRKFQSMDQKEAHKFLRKNPLAKAIMMGNIGKDKENKDD